MEKIRESSAGGHNDIAYGVYDRPGPQEASGTFDVEEFVFEPIVPSEQMATQLSIDKPPVEDPEYAPVSKQGLSAAAAELAKSVAPANIGKFYRDVKKLAFKYEEVAPETVGEEEMLEKALRKNVRGVLQQMLRESFHDDPYDVEKIPGADYVDDEFPDEDEEEAVYQSEPATFEDIAKVTGHSGPAGAKQMLNRLERRMKIFAADVTDEDLRAVQNYAAGEFVDLMVDAGFVDEPDGDILRSNPTELFDLDSFRYFFTGAFVIPAFKKLERDGRRKVEKQLSSMGVPSNVQHSIMLQVQGSVPRNNELLRKRFSAAVSKGQIDAAAALELIENIIDAMPVFQQIFQDGSDIVTTAIDIYGSRSEKTKNDLLKQALTSTEEFQTGA